MRIIRIAGKKITVKYVVNRKTGEVQMIPQEGYNPEHTGIENLLPTHEGKVTPNDPRMFPAAEDDIQNIQQEQQGSFEENVINL